MKYANAFTLNVTQNECFIKFQQGIPQGEQKITEDVEGIILNEKVARQLAAAIEGIYGKIDEKRDAYKRAHAENSSKVS